MTSAKVKMLSLTYFRDILTLGKIQI